VLQPQKLNEKLSPNKCICHPQETTVTCSCQEQNLDVYLSNKEFILPLDTQGMFLYSDGRNVKAELKQFVTLEAQIMLQGLNLVSTFDKARCYIDFKKIEGCYKCLTGAKLELSCRTDFGETLSHINCETFSFSITCSVNSSTHKITINLNRANITESCNVKCSGGLSSFIIYGILDFIAHNYKLDFKNIIPDVNNNSLSGLDMDMSFFMSTLFRNWKSTGITILIGIILFVATIFLFPIVIRILLFLLSWFFKNMIKLKTRKKNL